MFDRYCVGCLWGHHRNKRDARNSQMYIGPIYYIWNSACLPHYHNLLGLVVYIRFQEIVSTVFQKITITVIGLIDEQIA